MSKANERQVGGEHYRKNGTEIQHWDYAEMKKFDKFQYVITKYIERWRDKNGILDLEKAKHYLEKYIEIEKKKLAGPALPGFLREMPPVVHNSGLVPTQRMDNTGQKFPFGFIASEELGTDNK